MSNDLREPADVVEVTEEEALENLVAACGEVVRWAAVLGIEVKDDARSVERVEGHDTLREAFQNFRQRALARHGKKATR
jgi:hypothetical protein